MKRRIVIKVSGQVQDVFFRHAARMQAERLGIVGSAKNEDDGSVTITAEGDEQDLGELAEWCKKGPPLARVNNVKAEWQEAVGKFKKFEIL